VAPQPTEDDLDREIEYAFDTDEPMLGRPPAGDCWLLDHPRLGRRSLLDDLIHAPALERSAYPFQTCPLNAPAHRALSATSGVDVI
jgi:hypothetical protein